MPYGPMIEMFDSPTIWEGWRRFIDEDTIATDEEYERFKRGDLLQPKGRRSLVHGGVGPALLLSQEVLGVHGVGTGFAECRIEVPEIQSVTWARGVFPEQPVSRRSQSSSTRRPVAADSFAARQSFSVRVACSSGVRKVPAPRSTARKLRSCSR